MSIGIPKAVGQEFVAADGTAGIAAGIIFSAPDGDILLLRRSGQEANYAGYWGLPGGGGEDGETPEQVAEREAREEMGGMAPGGVRKLVDARITPNNKAFYTYAQPVTEKFAPQLDHEHSGYAWAPLSMLPQPVHPSIMLTLQERLGLPEAPSAEDCAAAGTNFSKWARDCEVAQDAALAFDRDSVRDYDRDGRLHVALTNISKANVCEYWGREIPNFAKLGLMPDRKYKLFRDPEELQKAAPTFNNLPLLSQHVPVSADDHKAEYVIGSTGTDAIFDGPFLRNSLVIWARNGIEAVESDVKKDLSAAYRYRADMSPGRTPQGEDFDGVMRDIVGNHVALVKEGRAGPDVVVGDSNEDLIMANKAIVLSRKGAMLLGLTHAALLPKLALDAKPKFNAYSLAPVFEGVTAANFKEKSPGFADGLKKVTAGMLAQDASLEDVVKLLDTMEKVDPAEDTTEPSAGGPAKKPAGLDSVNEFLKGKLGADDFSNYEQLMAGSTGDEKEETDEEKAKREKDEADKKAKDEADAESKKEEDKKAMDSAITKAVTTAVDAEKKRQRDLRDAEKRVRPWVGELAMAHDSAEDVYRTALETLGVKVEGVHPTALLPILEATPKPGSRNRKDPVLAQDAAGAASFSKRFPGSERIGSV